MRKQGTNSLVKIIAIVGLIGAVIALLHYMGISSYFSFEGLKAKSFWFKEQVQINYWQSALIFMAAYCGLILITLPIVAPMTLLGGYLFGLRDGFCLSLIAQLVGSLSSFLIIRYVVSSFIRDRYKDKLDEFNEKIKKYGYSYLVTLQLLSIVPFVVINTMAALGGVPTFAVFWTTLLGAIPVTFVYTLAGQEFATINSASDILNGKMLGVLLLLAALAAMPMLIKIIQARSKEKQG